MKQELDSRRKQSTALKDRQIASIFALQMELRDRFAADYLDGQNKQSSTSGVADLNGSRDLLSAQCQKSIDAETRLIGTATDFGQMFSAAVTDLGVASDQVHLVLNDLPLVDTGNKPSPVCWSKINLENKLTQIRIQIRQNSLMPCQKTVDRIQEKLQSLVRNSEQDSLMDDEIQMAENFIGSVRRKLVELSTRVERREQQLEEVHDHLSQLQSQLDKQESEVGKIENVPHLTGSQLPVSMAEQRDYVASFEVSKGFTFDF